MGYLSVQNFKRSQNIGFRRMGVFQFFLTVKTVRGSKIPRFFFMKNRLGIYQFEFAEIEIMTCSQ